MSFDVAKESFKALYTKLLMEYGLKCFILLNYIPAFMSIFYYPN